MKLISFVFLAVCVFYAKADFKIGLSNQGVPELSTRLIGAKDAKKGQFPYQVGLRKKFIHFQFCGASLINSRYLLTAAHCIVDTFAEEIYAAIGALYRTKQGHVRDGFDVDIEELIPYLEYDSDTFDFYVGLMLIAKEIVFTKFELFIQPFALPTCKTEIKLDLIFEYFFLPFSTKGGPVVEVVNCTKELIGIVSSAIGVSIQFNTINGVPVEHISTINLFFSVPKVMAMMLLESFHTSIGSKNK